MNKTTGFPQVGEGGHEEGNEPCCGDKWNVPLLDKKAANDVLSGESLCVKPLYRAGLHGSFKKQKDWTTEKTVGFPSCQQHLL